MRSGWAFILFILFVPLCLVAAPGETSLPFLLSDMDPATTGQAGALLAGADDMNALVVNPAGLGLLQWQGLKFSYNTSFFDFKYNSLMLALPLYFGGLGFNLGYFYTNPVDEIRNWSITSEKMRFYDLLAGLSYGGDFRFMKGVLTAGVTAKYVYEQLGWVNGRALLFDVGFQYHFTFLNFDRLNKYEKNFSAGLVVKDLGTGIKYSDDVSQSVPVLLGLGASVKPMKFFRTELDLMTSPETTYQIKLGTELYFFRNITPVLGLTLEPGMTFFSLGLGFSYFISTYEFVFDFSGRFNSILGNNMLLGVTLYRTGLDHSSLKKERILVMKEDINHNLSYPKGVKIGVLDIRNNIISMEIAEFINLLPNLLNNYLKQMSDKNINVIERSEILDIYKSVDLKPEEYHSEKAIKSIGSWIDMDLVLYGYTVILNKEKYLRLEMMDVKKYTIASTEYFSLENLEELDLLEKIGKHISMVVRQLVEK